MSHFRPKSLQKSENCSIFVLSPAGVVKLVDAPDSKSGTRESVRVRFPPPALNV